MGNGTSALSPTKKRRIPPLHQRLIKAANLVGGASLSLKNSRNRRPWSQRENEEPHFHPNKCSNSRARQYKVCSSLVVSPIVFVMGQQYQPLFTFLCTCHVCVRVCFRKLVQQSSLCYATNVKLCFTVLVPNLGLNFRSPMNFKNFGMGNVHRQWGHLNLQ